MSASRTDRTIGLAVLVLAVLLALLPLVIGSPPESVAGSVASSEEHGRRALDLLVREVGFEPEVWSQPPGRLPRGEHTLWLAAAPKSWGERRPKKHALLQQKIDHEEPGQSGDKRESPAIEPDEHDAAPAGNPDEKSSSNPDEKPAINTDEKPAGNAKEKSASDTDEQPAGNTDAKSASSAEDPSSGAPGDEEESAAQDNVPSALGSQSLSNYRRFVEEGGTLLMRFDARGKRFLCEYLALENLCDLALDPEAPAGVRLVHTESGEELEADWPKGAIFRDLPPNGPVRALWTAARAEGERDEVLAVVTPVGSGRVLLLGDDSFLDNGKIGQNDHALLAVRLAEHVRPGGRLLFDEFALGLWQPPTVSGLATSPALFLVTAHLFLCACLFVWARAWVSTFPRDPEALARLSPLSRARARAALYERAGRIDLLADMLRRGSVRRWLAIAHLRRTRVAGDATGARTHAAEARAPAAEPRAPAARPRSQAAEPRAPATGPGTVTTAARALTSSPDLLETEIDRIAHSRGTPEKSVRWREVVVRRRVRNTADLDLLQRDLASIETEIEAPTESGERRSSARAG